MTRWAEGFPLAAPGAITVNSARHILVADKLTPDKYQFDAKENILYDTMLLHFDERGSFMEYLGRQGRGGAPFPRINNIYSSINDEIVVVSEIADGFRVYWFSSGGNLLFQNSFRKNPGMDASINADIDSGMDDDIGVTDRDASNTGDTTAGLVINSISAAPDERILYIEADHYTEEFDMSTGTSIGRAADESFVRLFAPDPGKYRASYEIPFYEAEKNSGGRTQRDGLFYSMLGAVKGRKLFFTFPKEDGYAILLLGADEKNEKKRGFINVSPDELEYNAFNISEEGIISAILASQFEVKVVWWRTDKLL
jgi:hypothetical protein